MVYVGLLLSYSEPYYAGHESHHPQVWYTRAYSASTRPCRRWSAVKGGAILGVLRQDWSLHIRHIWECVSG